MNEKTLGVMPLTYSCQKFSAGPEITNVEPCEIEITPEMIEAGMRAYRNRDSRFMLDRDIVEDIFMSMMEAKGLPSPGAKPAARHSK
jgi:hypothetical protein